MRWPTKEKRQRRPADLDQRTRHVFAWKPTKVGDEMVWMERYAVRELFYGDEWVQIGATTCDYY